MDGRWWRQSGTSRGRVTCQEVRLGARRPQCTSCGVLCHIFGLFRRKCARWLHFEWGITPQAWARACAWRVTPPPFFAEYLGDADEEAPPPGAVDDAMTSDAFEMGPDAELDDPVPHDAGNSSPAGATPQGAPRSAPRSARGQAVPPPPAGRSPSHRPEPASGASAGADTAVVADDPETPPSHRLNTGGRNGTSPTASWRESSLAASGRRAAGGGAVAGPIVPSATDGGDYDHMAEGELRELRPRPPLALWDSCA